MEWQHVRCLRACGYVCAPGAAGAPALYRDGVLALVALYLAQECAAAWRARLRLDELARVLFLLLCHVTALAKQLALRRRAARLQRLLARLDEPQWRGADPQQRAQVVATLAHATRFLRAYAGVAVVTCSLWATFAAARRARGQCVQLPLWLPFDYQPPAAFAAVLMYSYYVTTLVGIANTTMDAFVATVLSQCRTQLRILRTNFERVPARAVAEARGQPRRGYEAALRELFLRSVRHHAEITETVSMVEDIFGGAILIQFGIGGWILCMAAYQMASLSVLSVEFASMGLFTSCILTELFLYCYYGNELTVESSRVCGALGAARWVGAPRRFRAALLLAMTCSRRPLLLRAGRLVPLSLDTFLKIIRSSYTFYAVLRQTGTD